MPEQVEVPQLVQEVPRDVRCVGCGYELEVLKPSGLCPECGWPVLQTIEHRRQLALRARPVPSFVRIVRTCGYAALPVLAIIQPIVYAYPPRWTVRHNTFQEAVGEAFLIVVAVGLANAVVGLRYRNGANWLIAWLVYSLAMAILSPAYGRS